MKESNLIPVVSFLLASVFVSCGNKTTSAPQAGPTAQELRDGKKYRNYVDAKGLRQGYWVVTGQVVQDSTYAPDATVMQGWYVDDYKDSVWTTFNPDGSVKATETYKRGMEIKNPGNENEFNYIDANGQRQGPWEITAAMAFGIKDSLHEGWSIKGVDGSAGYAPNAIVETGWYKDNKKDSVWTTFNPDGSVKATVTYENGVEVK